MDIEIPFKYHKFQGRIAEILGSKKISAASVGENLLCFGTYDGFVLHCDMQGNNICTRRVFEHNEPVVSISIDSYGDMIAGCCASGKVVIFDFRERIQKSQQQSKGKDNFIIEDLSVGGVGSNGGGAGLTAVCVEEGRVEGRARTYVVGTSAGEIVQYKVGSKSSKKRPVRLFDGANTPVSAIAWCGAVLAWADSRHVRLLSVPNQTALCFINAPTGIPMDSASSCFTPCSLFWEAQNRLLVGWGDTFRQVDLSGGYIDQQSGGGGGGEDDNSSGDKRSRGGSGAGSDTSEALEVSARVSAEWTVGCVVCRVAPLDVDHVVVLGFSPPSDEIIHNYLSTQGQGHGVKSVAGAGAGEAEMEGEMPQYVMPYKALYPDLYVVQRFSGAVVSTDSLPLPGCTIDNFRSPSDFLLLTSYSARSGRRNYQGWKLTTSREKKGGTKGLSPTMFVLSASPPAAISANASASASVGPITGAVVSSSGVVSMKSLHRSTPGTGSGVIVARVRDTQDRIAAALKAHDLRSAVYYARADRAAVKPAGNFDLLVSMYLEDLLDCGHFDTAAEECRELIGLDTALWERWISVFHRFNALSSLVRQLPVRQLRLSETVIESVLYQLLTSDTRAFLETARAWGQIDPPRFDKRVVLSRLEAMRSQPNQASNVWQKTGVLEGMQRLDSYVLEAMAALHTFVGQFEEALDCFLDIDPAELGSSGDGVEGPQQQQQGYPTLPSAAASSSSSSSSSSSVSATGVSTIGATAVVRDFHLAFELIERHNLYAQVAEKLFTLIRLNKTLAGKLLVKHLDRYPVSSVLRQLSGSGSSGRRWQLWYLHTLFLTIPDVYNSSEFAEYHVLQIALYCEFAPPPPNSMQLRAEAELLAARKTVSRSDGGSTAAIAAAAACGYNQRTSLRPPIIETQANIYTSDLMIFLKVSSFVPLDMALRECQQVKPTPLYPEIIYIYSRLGNKKQALELLLTKIGDVKMIIEFVESHDRALWADVIDYATSHPVFLGSLLDRIGKCSTINPAALLQRIPPNTEVPFLRERLQEVVSAHMFQTFLTEKCGDVLFSDTVSLLRKLNHGQRRAIKIDQSQLSARCCLCGKALCRIPDYDTCTIIASNELVHQLQKSGTIGSGGGGGGSAGGASGSGGGSGVNNKSSLHGAVDNPVSVASMNVLWRSGCAQNYSRDSGVAIFHSKGNSFHRVCYRKLMNAGQQQLAD